MGEPLYKKEPAYNCWATMIARCCRKAHKSYPEYGGSGIMVFPAWKGNFHAFLKHIGPRPSKKHSIDRIDNSKGYFPGNVRWATRKEQSQNSSRPKLVRAFGAVKNITEWAAEHGLNNKTLSGRIARGIPPETAMTMKSHSRQPCL